MIHQIAVTFYNGATFPSGYYLFQLWFSSMPYPKRKLFSNFLSTPVSRILHHRPIFTLLNLSPGAIFIQKKTLPNIGESLFYERGLLFERDHDSNDPQILIVGNHGADQPLFHRPVLQLISAFLGPIQCVHISLIQTHIFWASNVDGRNRAKRGDLVIVRARLLSI